MLSQAGRLHCNPRPRLRPALLPRGACPPAHPAGLLGLTCAFPTALPMQASPSGSPAGTEAVGGEPLSFPSQPPHPCPHSTLPQCSEPQPSRLPKACPSCLSPLPSSQPFFSTGGQGPSTQTPSHCALKTAEQYCLPSHSTAAAAASKPTSDSPSSQNGSCPHRHPPRLLTRATSRAHLAKSNGSASRPTTTQPPSDCRHATSPAPSHCFLDFHITRAPDPFYPNFPRCSCSLPDLRTLAATARSSASPLRGLSSSRAPTPSMCW